MLESFSIDDGLEHQMSGAIEVSLQMVGGGRRWCYFMRPEALAACGDWITGTETRLHFGAPHMIVIAGELTEVLIEKALRQIAAQGVLEQCSIPIV